MASATSAASLILIVDDTPGNNLQEIDHLKREGHVVITTASASSAMALLGSGIQPDVIISDMGRQEDSENGESGYKPTAGLLLIQEIRRSGRMTPIIIYTTLESVERYREETIRLGGNNIVCLSRDLYAAVADALRSGPSSAVEEASDDDSDDLMDTSSDDNDNEVSLIEAVEAIGIARVRELLVDGGDVNERDVSGTTALMCASAEGSYDIVELLLANRAAVNATNKTGNTALMSASRNGRTNVVALLLDKNHGANVNEVDENRDTALTMARRNGHNMIVTLLEQNGATDASHPREFSFSCLFDKAFISWRPGMGYVNSDESLHEWGINVNTMKSTLSALFKVLLQDSGEHHHALTRVEAGPHGITYSISHGGVSDECIYDSFRIEKDTERKLMIVSLYKGEQHVPVSDIQAPGIDWASFALSCTELLRVIYRGDTTVTIGDTQVLRYRDGSGYYFMQYKISRASTQAQTSQRQVEARPNEFCFSATYNEAVIQWRHLPTGNVSSEESLSEWGINVDAVKSALAALFKVLLRDDDCRPTLTYVRTDKPKPGMTYLVSHRGIKGVCIYDSFYVTMDTEKGLIKVFLYKGEQSVPLSDINAPGIDWARFSLSCMEAIRALYIIGDDTVTIGQPQRARYAHDDHGGGYYCVEYRIAPANNAVEDGQRQRDGSQEGGLCVVCREKPAEMALVPCGHLCLCIDECGQRPDLHSLLHGLCPYCRIPFTQSMRIYR